LRPAILFHRHCERIHVPGSPSVQSDLDSLAVSTLDDRHNISPAFKLICGFHRWRIEKLVVGLLGLGVDHEGRPRVSTRPPSHRSGQGHATFLRVTTMMTGSPPDSQTPEPSRLGSVLFSEQVASPKPNPKHSEPHVGVSSPARPPPRPPSTGSSWRYPSPCPRPQGAPLSTAPRSPGVLRALGAVAIHACDDGGRAWH